MSAPAPDLENANAVCVGPSSESAGKASSCAGCPNQEICATGKSADAKAETEKVASDIVGRLSRVRHKILVLSGKGGVGKSTFAAQLGFGLSERDAMVGLMDIDICGPSAPKMTGLEGEEVRQSNNGWSPVFVKENFGVMSVAFLLDNDRDAVIWRGPRKDGLIRQFLRDVDWGDLDYLVVDSPPGTSDEHLSIAAYLKQAGVDGAILVTTPQEVAMTDVRKEINFCVKLGIPMLGVVENMGPFTCPHCSKDSVVFPASTGGGRQLAADYGVPFLGSIPLDPRIAMCAENGESFHEAFPESPAANAYRSIIDSLVSTMPFAKKMVVEN